MYIDTNLMWRPNSEGQVKITIGFLHPNKHHFAQGIVKQSAAEWEEAIPGLVFHWRDDPKHCEVRIDFWDSDDARSEPGNLAKGIHDHHKPTMRLPRHGETSDLKRMALHEFGHVLGAVHEQLNPSFPWKWDRAAVVNHFKHEFKHDKDDNGVPLSHQEILHNAKGSADAYTLSDLVNPKYQLYSQFDPNSIMLYDIQANWLIKKHHNDPTPEDMNQATELSETDKSSMRDAYIGKFGVHQASPQEHGTWYYPYAMPYYPLASVQQQSYSNAAPLTDNICHNPDCGRTFVCKDDYNRRVRAGGAPGIP
jgi:serralysin